MRELQSAHQLYLKSGRTIRGPLTLQRLQQLRDASRLSKLDQISSDRINWVTAGLVPELFEPEIVQIQSTAWFYKKGTEQVGPYCIEELRELAATSMFQPTDRVWCEGMQSWKPANSIRELCICFGPTVSSARSFQPWIAYSIAGLALAACTIVVVITFMWHPTNVSSSVDSIAAASGVGPHTIEDVPCPTCHGQPIFSECGNCRGTGYTSCTNSYTTTTAGFLRKITYKYSCRAGDIYYWNENNDTLEKTVHKCTVCLGRGEVRCNTCKSEKRVQVICKTCDGAGTVRK